MFPLICQAQTIVNGSFETPNYGWTFSGTAGISGSSFYDAFITSGAPEVPDGNHVAYLGNGGSLEQTVYLTPASEAILTFQATQSAINGSAVQYLTVIVDNGQQLFHLASPEGKAYPTNWIIPPFGYYEIYSIKLAPVTYAGYHPIKILSGYYNTAVLIDTVSITTTSSHAYGLWDQQLNNGTWRSDQPSSTTPISFGPCIYTGSSGLDQPDQIVSGGATPNGTPPVGKSSPCYGVPGGPAYPPLVTKNANWYSSPGYTAGSPHWLVNVNSEFLDFPECGSGPGVQSLPIVTPGNTGIAVSINRVTTQSDPKIGNYNVVSLITGIGNNKPIPTYCIPYIGFGANSAHGNAKAIAIMDTSVNYRPHLKFSASIFDFDKSSLAASWVYISISGWSDNIKRMIGLQLGNNKLRYDFMPKLWWNWNFKNSFYYPGGVISFWRAYPEAGQGQDQTSVNETCPGTITPSNPINSGLSFTATYLGNNANPVSYDIDLYGLISCFARKQAWGLNSIGSLPNPITVSGVEWSLEMTRQDSAPNMGGWMTIWNPRVE